MDSIIEPFSPAGRDFHTKGSLPYCDWSAIPGGIPSALINGICIKNQSYENEYIEKIKSLFPNATIFNGDLEIIYAPERVENQNNFFDNIESLVEDCIQPNDQTNEEPLNVGNDEIIV